MICKDISFALPRENILYDDALLQLAEAECSDDVLRFWESPKTFIVLGRISKEKDDLKEREILKDKIPVLRRSSGGGTVVQGKGCLNYTLILSKERHPALNGIHSSYEYILSQIVEALRGLGIDSRYLPVSDIALAENLKKFSGNAQKRSKKYILHHGTILYDFDLAQIERYLEIPQAMPDYREQRGHMDFVANIGRPAKDIQRVIAQVFKASKAVTAISKIEKEALKSRHLPAST